MDPETHKVKLSDGRRVDVREYPNGDVRISVKKGAPMTLAQFFATGNEVDVIVLLRRA